MAGFPQMAMSETISREGAFFHDRQALAKKQQS